MGRRAYPDAKKLFITADAGGSNGYRSRAWKLELQRFADDTGLRIRVSHFPPGTSKWNKIEHRLFSHITQNWRGRPLVSFETVVKLIGSTTTRTGLRVRARLNRRSYPLGENVTDEQMESLDLGADAFHGDWNYTLSPRKGSRSIGDRIRVMRRARPRVRGGEFGPDSGLWPRRRGGEGRGRRAPWQGGYAA